jgi:hypothetical protein
VEVCIFHRKHQLFGTLDEQVRIIVQGLGFRLGEGVEEHGAEKGMIGNTIDK